MPMPPTTTRQFQDWLMSLIEEHNELNECDDSAYPKGRFIEGISGWPSMTSYSCIVKLNDDTMFTIAIDKIRA